ncbi:MAG: type VI secretion system tip protein VgrG [Planctomycetaceae bacterium]|nr:MAG: type VI secretion system tip protein VgrG [Planctomycetaceae bacterium]
MPTAKPRPISLTTPLGGDVLWFHSLTGQESLGRPFVYQLVLLSENGQIAINDLLGKAITVELPTINDGQRFFHGCVTNFSQAGMLGRFHHYLATLRPWLWFLTRTSDCRIFQNMTAPDIIKQIFRDRGFSDYQESLSGTYREREYCVQYRETDFNFVSRLMEEEGIYYYFKHEPSKHTLVLSDSANSHGAVAGYAEIPFYPEEGHTARPDQMLSWKASQEVRTCKYALRDFDYLNPQANLESKATETRQHAHADLEVYDYPGLYAEASDGEAYVKTRLQELQAAHATVEAVGGPRGLSCGNLFKLIDHPRSDQNREYLVVSASYELLSPEYEGSDMEVVGSGFQIRLTAIASNIPYRAPRWTPKPFVQGIQTAMVTGKQGEEIWTDEHGRVKVQFHWDRAGQKDENSSCWIRVASTWAGNAWGAIQLPRIGQEVIVDFLEGDPDRPLITGRVYNADNKPPYTLPEKKTQSGVKSRTSKEGTVETFNELRFEDKKDAEQIYFHAEKDFDRVVENNDTLKVGFEKKDQGDQTIEIHNNQKLVVGNSEAKDGSQTIEIWNNRTETVKEGDENVTIEKGNRDIVVTKGNDTHHVGQGNREVKIDQGNDTLTITQGNQTIKISAGKSTIEAGTSIELKVGGSSIKIEPAKITIKSPEIAIQADMKLGAKGSMTEVSGDAMLTLKGGLVKIN